MCVSIALIGVLVKFGLWARSGSVKIRLMKWREWYKKYEVWCWPVLAGLIVTSLWLAILLVNGPDLEMVKMIENGLVKTWFERYGLYLGLVANLISIFLSYVGLALLKVSKKLERRWWVLAWVLVAFMPWLLLANQLLYGEVAYSDPVKGGLAYAALPSQWSVLVLIVVASGYWIWQVGKWRRLPELAKILTVLLIVWLGYQGLGLSWGRLNYLSCGLVNSRQQDQCYQWAAIQASELEWCERITGAVFVGLPANPMRDKCYLQIAKTVGKLEACDQIKGGLMSYSREECLQAIVKNFADPRACERLQDLEAIRCQMALLIDLKPEKIEQLEVEIGSTKDLARREELKARLAAMKKVLKR